MRVSVLKPLLHCHFTLRIQIHSTMPTDTIEILHEVVHLFVAIVVLHTLSCCTYFENRLTTIRAKLPLLPLHASPLSYAISCSSILFIRCVSSLSDLAL